MSELNDEDCLSLSNIITLIASDALHRTDYISQKRAGVGLFVCYTKVIGKVVDSEVDAYLMEQLIGNVKAAKPGYIGEAIQIM